MIKIIHRDRRDVIWLIAWIIVLAAASVFGW
jgi:hypothetical protein